MFSTKILAILAIIMVAVFSPALISQAAEPPSVGTASIEDDQASGDSVVITLSGITPGTYTAALISGNDVEILSIGSADVVLPVIQGVTQTTGTLNITFDSNSDGYDGSDLLSTYSRITISGADGLIAYSDALPSSATAEINAAIADSAALNKALDAALSAAKEAQSASTKATIDEKMETAFVNIAGINAFANAMDVHAQAAITAAPDEAGVGAAASKVREMAANIKAWASTANATATNDVATNDSVTVQKIFVDRVVDYLNAARNGYDADNSGSIGDVVTDTSDPDLPVETSDGTGEGGGTQAYTAARNMANFSLTASPLPAAEVTEVVVEPEPEPEPTTHILDLGLPSVGERILAPIMQVSMVIGLAFVGVGGLLLAKSRRQ
jgi:hypothetical protein